MRQTHRTFRRLQSAALLLLLLALLPVQAAADSLSGGVEYFYAKSSTTSREGSSPEQRFSSVNQQQRYRLMMDKTLFPLLRFSASGLVERSTLDAESDGVQSSSTLTRFVPNANLSWGTPVLSANMGFARREETASTSDGQSATSILDSYNGMIAWKPEGFPQVSLLVSRLHAYDADKKTRDTISDSMIANSSYKPLPELDLSYQAIASSARDNIAGSEVQSLLQSGRGAYSRQFGERVSFSTSYSMLYQSSETTRGGSAVVATQKLPVRGLFAVNTLTNPDPGDLILDDTPAVIDGTAQIRIGYLPANAPSSPRPVNIGMQFNTAPTINVLRLLLPSGRQIPLDGGIRASFLNPALWEVYTSTDPTGRIWKRLSGVTVTYSTFLSFTGTSVDGFEFSFPQVPDVQFVKVVMSSPLTINSIFLREDVTVSKLEAYFTGVIRQGSRSDTLSGHYELSTRVRLLDSPSLLYDMSYSLNHFKADQTSLSVSWFLMNSLSTFQRFNRILSGSARVAREDSEGANGDMRSSNNVSLSLTATPLPTLSHTVVYSFRHDQSPTGRKIANSMYLSNTAELYRGLSLNLSAGGTLSNDEAGVTQKSLNVSTGAFMQPHPSLTFTLSFSDSRAWSSGGGKPDSSTSSQGATMSATYSPFPSLYLFGELGYSAEKGRPSQQTSTVGGSWAPFRGGALVYNVSYRESYSSSGDQKDGTLSNSLRWNIRSGTSLDCSHQLTDSTSSFSASDSESLIMAFRTTF